MANNKYKYYVTKNNTIVSRGFDEFTDTLSVFLNCLRGNSFKILSIVKADNQKNLKNVNINKECQDYYIFLKTDGGSKQLWGPFSYDKLETEFRKKYNTYGTNSCNFFGIINVSKEDSIKLFNII